MGKMWLTILNILTSGFENI